MTPAADGRCSDQAYHLVLAYDTHTTGHAQWFYFAVGHTQAGARVSFHIVARRDEEEPHGEAARSNSPRALMHFHTCNST